MQVLQHGTVVGIVMQFLPNGSLHRLVTEAKMLTFQQAITSSCERLQELRHPLRTLRDITTTTTIAERVSMPVDPSAMTPDHLDWVRSCRASALLLVSLRDSPLVSLTPSPAAVGTLLLALVRAYERHTAGESKGQCWSTHGR